MKDKFFSEREYYLDNIWFTYEGISYKGNGVLTWNPEKGFHLIGNIKGNKRPNRKEFRSIDPASKPVRMIYEVYSKGQNIKVITPPLQIDEMGLLWDGKYSSNFGHALFLSNLNEHFISEDTWHGSAIYEASRKLLFPDTLFTETKIGDVDHGQSFSRAGFRISDNNVKQLVGEIKDDKFLYFNWDLPKEHWTKERHWRFAEALRDALSIFSGEVLQLRYHESHRINRLAQEYDSNGKPSSLGLVFCFLDYDIVPKEAVIQLAAFLSQPSENERIIKKIFWQVVNASNQNLISVSELILSTVLEASLRTIYGLPFVPGRPSKDDPFKTHKLLKQFQKDRLTGEYDEQWKRVIKAVNESYVRLRHRNAHPDWLSSEGGMLSPDALEQTLNDMVLLSRFYGYMILALSGRKDFEPKSPAKISDWKPIMTMEIKQKDI
jgi:hypothetical protein